MEEHYSVDQVDSEVRGSEQSIAPDFSFKVIVVGNKRVGKTSITNRCVFDEFNEHSQSTRVVQVVPKIVKIRGTDKMA